MNDTTPITVGRTDFAGLLTDISAHALAHDDLPWLNCVSLHTAEHPSGERVLVATATDQFTLAQAHISLVPAEPVSELPSVFLPLAAVRRVGQWLRTYRDDQIARHVHIAATPAADAVTFSFDLAGGSLTERTFISGAYPDVARVLTDSAGKEPAPGEIRAEYLARFVHAATRRREPLRITTHGDSAPAAVTIGDQFRGLAMTLPPADTDARTAPVFPLPSEPTKSKRVAA